GIDRHLVADAVNPRIAPGQAALPSWNAHRLSPLQFVNDQRKGVARRVLTHEDVEMPISGEFLETVLSRRVAVEEVIGARHAFGEEAIIVLTAQEYETRIGFWRRC